MSNAVEQASPPEYNVTSLDFAGRDHFRYGGPPLIDVHAPVRVTREGPDAGLAQAEQFLAVAQEFDVERVWTMCAPEDIPPLRERFGPRLGFNGFMIKKPDEPDEAAYRLLDRFLSQDVGLIKFWASPRAEGDSLFRDVPWRANVIRRAWAAGVRVVMVHVADPDLLFQHRYTDRDRYGTKADHYAGLERMIQEFPDVSWIAAHMGGDPENPDHLEKLLGLYPNLSFDTSATKWQVREMSLHSQQMKRLICRYPDRFLFGSDLVTRPGLSRDHYVSRYWCQRTLLESDWRGQSPIEDPDWRRENASASPTLVGLNLPAEVLELVYRGNARRLLPS